MALPKAVSRSTKRPGFYLFIDLLAGATATGNGTLRALLITWASGNGNIVVEEEVRRVYSSEDLLAALGDPVPGYAAGVKLFEAYGEIALDVVAMEAPDGTAASGSYVITGTPTTPNVFEFDCKGEKVGTLTWSVGEAASAFATRVRTAFSGARTLPVTPAVGSAAHVVDLDALTDGTWGNDITFGVRKISGAGGVVTPTGARLANGTGECDPTIALSRVVASEYAAIGLVTSNADASDNTGTAGPEIVMEHVEENLFGGQSKLQYFFVGHTGSISTVKAGAIGRNSTVGTYAYMQNAQSLPAEVMGWEMGDALRWYSQRANYNRIGNPSPLVGSKDRNADALTVAECEDLLRSGVTPYDFAENSDEVVCVCPITTHSLDGTAPDDRCFYQSDVFGQFAVARDMRTFLPQTFKNCSVTEDLPAGEDDLPANVVERRDVEAEVFGRLRGWVPKGVLKGGDLEASIADGTVAVELDSAEPGGDDSQVNIFIPDDIVKPLAKFSVVFNKRQRA